MVPHVARAGWSFKGAFQYYMHDKEAQTKERVGWTYTHNLPTDNAALAVRTMITTAKNAEALKRSAGIANTGRKMKSGPVYSYSLSWHPEQKPDKQTMLDAALETLHLLKLQEHEAVVVNHTDEEHDHVHVIVNLIHPETGRKAVVSYDYLSLSTWAEQVETLEGEIRCEQRVINNEQRRQHANENRQLALVKHRDKKVERAEHIQKLYSNTTNGHAFKSALKLAGYTLAQGHKGRYVIVDKYGEVHNVARQLEGQRARHLRERFKDLKELPDAKALSKERSQPFDRDQYETERQKKIVDAAVEQAKDHDKSPQMNKRKTQTQSPEISKDTQPKTTIQKQQQKERKTTKTPKLEQPKQEKQQLLQPNPDTEHLRKLDELSAWEQNAALKRDRLKIEQQEQYKRGDLKKKIAQKEEQIKNAGWFTNKKKLQQSLDALNKNMENIDQRIQEQNQKLERQIAKEHPDYLEQLRQKEAEYDRRIAQHSEQRSHKHDRDIGFER